MKEKKKKHFHQSYFTYKGFLASLEIINKHFKINEEQTRIDKYYDSNL